MAFQNIHREAVRSGFVRALRVAFESNMDYQYRTSPNDPNQPADDSKIFIYDSWPWTNVKYPCIIVSLGSGDPMMRTIGGEYQIDTFTPFVSQDGLTHRDVSSEYFGGGQSSTVRIAVYARTSVDRSQIMDWVDIYIRSFFVSLFNREGASIVGMSQGSEIQTQIGTDPVYIDSVDVSVYSEFQRQIPANLTIDALCLTGIFSITPDGTTT